METTRHFTATVYIVEGDATALHAHEELGIRIPPGGHIDRDELPHEAALREVYEETGLEPALLSERPELQIPAGTSLPQPQYQLLYDVTVDNDGNVSHQHIDHIYFAVVHSRQIDPQGENEADPSVWQWYDREALESSSLDADTAAIGCEAIEMARTHSSEHE
jgi:ADP-ribose pyrophosphatase